MNRVAPIVIGALALLALFVGFSSIFIVQQGEQALVLQFGEPRRVVQDPGLKFKMPFLQTVTYYEQRLIEVDTELPKVLLSDQKGMIVDTYTQYRITDPLAFFQKLKNEAGAENRLSTVIKSSVTRVLGSHTLGDVLSEQRDPIMASILGEVAAKAKEFGIEVVDVRLRRADLPDEISKAIFNRMKSERDREAKQARAEGQQAGIEIKARADRDRTVLLAEAQRDAQSLRGEGDGMASKIYAEAYGKDPDFYAFFRSLQSYREALTNGDTTFVLSPDSQFFKYFGSVKGLPAPKQ